MSSIVKALEEKWALTCVTYHQSIAGTRIHLNNHPIGWLMTTINSKWTFSIDDYKLEKPFDDLQECKDAIMVYIDRFIEKKTLEGERRSAKIDFDFDKELSNIYQELAANQKPLPPEFQLTDEEFWSLL